MSLGSLGFRVPATGKHRYCGKIAPELQMVRTNALPMNYDGVVDRVKPPAPRIVGLDLNCMHKGEQGQSYWRPQPLTRRKHKTSSASACKWYEVNNNRTSGRPLATRRQQTGRG